MSGPWTAGAPWGATTKQGSVTSTREQVKSRSRKDPEQECGGPM